MTRAFRARHLSGRRVLVHHSLRRALLLELPGVKIVTVNVPMIADENKWKCKVVLR